MGAPLLDTVQRPDAALDSRLRVFSGLWALGHLMHLINNSALDLQNGFGVLTAFAAFYVLANPGSISRLALLAAAQLAHVVWTAPLIPDHWTLAAFGNLAILLSFARSAGKRNRGGFGEIGPTIFGSVVPALKLTLIVAYSAAALAKYNTTFLDPVTSCANFLTRTGTFDLLGGFEFVGPLHVLTAIVPETLIPILLIVPRSRRFGVRFAIAFHLFVASSPLLVVGDFSVILTALFLLFAPNEDVEAVLTAIRNRLASDPLAARLRGFNRPIAVCAVSTIITTIVASLYNRPASPWVWVLTVFILPRILWTLLRMPRQRERIEPLGSVSIPHLGLCALLLVWVLTPYLGYRTTGVFTMFSNLRTEGPGTNHLFMPSYDLTDYQTDLVVPAPGSSEHFDTLIENGQAVSIFEVRRYMSTDAGITVVGTRNGHTISEADIEEFRQPVSGWENRLVQLRAVPFSGDLLCTN